MSVANLRILAALGLLAGVGLVAYPAALWLHSELIAWMRAPDFGADRTDTLARLALAPVAGQLGSYLSFSTAFVIACAALKGQIRNLIAAWSGAALRGAVIIAVAACLLWLGLLFTLSLLASLDRFFVGTVFVVTLGLLISSRLVLGLVRASGWTAIGGLGAILAVSYGVPAEHAVLRSAVATVMALSMLVSFSILGSALARRGSAATTQLIVCLAAGFVLFVAGSFFLGTLVAVSRSVLLVSFASAIVLSLIPIVIGALLNRRVDNPALYHPGQSLQSGAWCELQRPTAASATGDTVWIVQRGEINLSRLNFLAAALADRGQPVVACVPAVLASQVRQGPWGVVTLPRIVPLRLRTSALLALVGRAARLFPSAGEDKVRRFAYACRPHVYHDKVSLRRFAVEHPELRPTVVVCVDWEAGPAAHALARSVNAKLVYDVSEYEPDQYFNDARWVATEAPIAAAVAAATQHASALTITCSEALRKRVGERSSGGDPIVIRTAPAMTSTPEFRPVDGRIHLLYRGDIIGTLGIEALVDAMATVRGRYRLTLSGQADHGFLGDLKRRITKLGVDEDVAIDLLDAPRSEPVGVVADAGIVLWSLDTPKAAYSVPAQLFEHVQAGRAVFLVGSGEAADLVRDAGVGHVIEGRTSTDIGAALDAASVTEVEAWKRAAVEASVEMNRSHFGQKLAAAL